MHILIDARSIHPHMGGIGRMTKEVITHLLKTGSEHEFSILTGMKFNDDPNWLGARIVQADAAMIDERFEQIGLPALLEELGVDLYLNTTFSVPALRTTRLQVSVIHDVVFEDRPEWVEPGLRAYLQRWSRFAADHADRIVTVSNHAAERIAAKYSLKGGQPLCIHNGMPKAAFKFPSREAITGARQRHALENPYLLYVGSLEPKKGIDQLLRAFARLLEGGQDDHQLALIGAAASKEWRVEDAIARSDVPADRVRALGYLPDEDRHALLAGCEAFVYPSLYEGFGLPPLEALALGRPCVVHDGTSLPEVVGEEALVVDAEDEKAFSITLEKALSDRGYRDRVAKSGPTHARTFSWEKAAGEYLRLFDELEAA